MNWDMLSAKGKEINFQCVSFALCFYAQSVMNWDMLSAHGNNLNSHLHVPCCLIIRIPYGKMTSASCERLKVAHVWSYHSRRVIRYLTQKMYRMLSATDKKISVGVSCPCLLLCHPHHCTHRSWACCLLQTKRERLGCRVHPSCFIIWYSESIEGGHACRARWQQWWKVSISQCAQGSKSDDMFAAPQQSMCLEMCAQSRSDISQSRVGRQLKGIQKVRKTPASRKSRSSNKLKEEQSDVRTKWKRVQEEHREASTKWYRNRVKQVQSERRTKWNNALWRATRHWVLGKHVHPCTSQHSKMDVYDVSPYIYTRLYTDTKAKL